MIFDNFSGAESILLWSGFGIALVLGLVVNKTNFCTMGAVSDIVNIGDWGRMRAWLLAIVVALLGVIVLESFGLVAANDAFPPYRMGTLTWAENLFGGFIFGIGMTLASGCGNKCLIRIGGGNIKSIMVFLVIGVVAYFMINPFPGSDQTLMSLLFIDWIRPLAVNVGRYQDLGSVISADNAVLVRLIVGGLLSFILLVFVFKSAEFRSSFNNILAGLVIGLCVVGAWYISSNININIEDEVVALRKAVTPDYWDMYEEFHEGIEQKPVAAPLSPQSFTFINPMGQTVGYVGQGLDRSLLTFGVMSVFGVILGSLLWSLISKGFRLEWFAGFKDFFNHFIGAILMGLGGVLALGCTIGQGITGISTLAIGSFITFFAIIFGSALTMKIQYYKLVYEEEATFIKALIASLADMHLLPASLRKLDAV
ncbi:MAG: YeeE/YedE family protein [Thiohalomonadaceae bacterium]